MLFNSFAFAVFFPIVFIVYWAIKDKYRNIWLLLASYWFYMSWNPKYIILILGITMVSFVSGRLLEKNRGGQTKRCKSILICALFLCIGVIFLFKYLNFAIEIVNQISDSLYINGKLNVIALVLPVGISFYTFQAIGYIVDVYRGTINAEKNFIRYALFVSYFPQLVAGPIERSTNLMKQIRQEKAFSYNQATYGMRLMLVGYFKKMVIADVISTYVDLVYNDITSYSGFILVFVTFLFAIQIYCDFSGYSDIAIGASKLLGIELMVNFKSPYFAVGFGDFWNRWHISLSSWLKDYVYIPLGGNRKGKIRLVYNLIVTFLLSGLWHGAAWNFILWGAIHGVVRSAEVIFNIKKSHKKAVALIQGLVTFMLVCIAWIFFRANSLQDGLYILTHLLTGINNPISYIMGIRNGLGIADNFIQIIAPILMLGVYDAFSLKYDLLKEVEKLRRWQRWCIYICGIILILMWMPLEENQAFIYFQF